MRIKPLIQWLKIDLKNRLVGSIYSCTWIDPEIGEQNINQVRGHLGILSEIANLPKHS